MRASTVRCRFLDRCPSVIKLNARTAAQVAERAEWHDSVVCYYFPRAHTHALLKKDTHNKTLRTDAQTLGPRLPRTPCPAHLIWRSEWGLSRGHCR